MAYCFSNHNIVVVEAYNHHNLPSRRQVLQSIWKVGAATAFCRPTRSQATEVDDKKAVAEAERKKREAEKEANRLAEETKKRLAVGRIGTI